MIHSKIRIGLDIGSRSIKAAVLDNCENILHTDHLPIKGPLDICLKNLLDSFLSSGDLKTGMLCALTGNNSQHFARVFGLEATNGILATYLGTKKLSPQAGAILEIGGEHAAFIRLVSTQQGEKVLKDFFVNSNCSAGTGTFLEQEAHRLNLSLEDFGRPQARSTPTVRIAGRCAVFAKTDIVHHHQNGVPLAAIASALCRAVALNIANELIFSHGYDPPLVFVGGVAANRGIQEALKDILKLDERSFLVPIAHLYTGAVGSLIASSEQKGKNACSILEALERLAQPTEKRSKTASLLHPLTPPPNPSDPDIQQKTSGQKSSIQEASLGIDIGSTSTNVVCLSPSGDVLAEKTLPTRGRALDAVYRGLAFLKDRFGTFQPKAVGFTGSGRKLAAEIIGADAILNEITAHALGGLHFFPGVDTIFDIGGQDSKFIRLHEGIVSDFAMNKVCSAGTGSFLEEMSELLGLSIIDEFAEEAQRSKCPLDLGERCTVFMSTELLRKLQEGEKRQDLAAGLCYSVVKNYLSRVVGRKSIGDLISFQGGVAGNAAIVSSLENFLQKSVYVHQHHDMAGAVGVALFASRQVGRRSRFRGFEDLNIQAIRTKSFDCTGCINGCRIHLTKDLAGKRFFTGGLCSRYEGRDLSLLRQKKDTLDLFEEREKQLSRWIKEPRSENIKDCIGIPRALHFYDLLPFWTGFFNELGIDYLLSGQTTKKTILKGAANCPTNPCLPLKTAYGHCLELKDKGVKKIFIPSISNLSFLTRPERMTHVCPASQAWPFAARSLFSEKMEFLTPIVRFSIPHYLKSDIVRIGRSMGFSKSKSLKAFQNALQAQMDFCDSVQKIGRLLAEKFEEDTLYAVLLSRSYTACDPITRHRLKKIFDELNIVAIPLDMAPFQEKTSQELEGMYWYYGKRFLQTIDALAGRQGITFIHLSNFGCGADSFIIHFLRERLKNSPFLELEIDEHDQFTGIATRLEAFALSQDKRKSKRTTRLPPKKKIALMTINHRKLLIPQMSDHAYAFQASFRAFGVDAEVLPLPDEESIGYGKQAVVGGECLPCSFVIGDMLKYLNNRPNGDRPPAFFMVSGDGPCRLGQYPYLQRLILDENGFQDTVIFDATQNQAFYDRFGILPAAFKRKTWQGVVSIDLLFRKWRETRPYVEDKERFDALYITQVKKVYATLQQNGSVREQLKSAFDRLEEPVNPSIRRKPVVAVLGENYVRCNSAANGKIADFLENLGAEVWFPSLYEWVYYGNWTARLHCLYEKNRKKYFKLALIDALQHWDESRISRSIKGRLRNLEEPSLKELFRLSSPYVPNTFEGETLIEVARTVDFNKKKCSGVIHVVPFGCMMGTIVETMSERLAEDLSGFPILTLSYDGLDYTSQISKLEGFMVRVRMWQEERRKNENIGVG
jgi:predicted CoA-substrate-specific enzyme activase